MQWVKFPHLPPNYYKFPINFSGRVAHLDLKPPVIWSSAPSFSIETIFSRIAPEELSKQGRFVFHGSDFFR